MIVANDVTQPGAGFEVETNIVTLMPAEGSAWALPIMSKTDVAVTIIEWAEKTVAARRLRGV